MRLSLLFLIFTFGFVKSVYIYDYEENTPRQFIQKFNEQVLHEDIPEPVNTLAQSNETSSTLLARNIQCEDFEEYAANCTSEAERIYNSPKTPPLSSELSNWCGALKFVANCATDWNVDCKDVTDKKFNEGTLKGQGHVYEKVCRNDELSVRYYDSSLDNCIRAITADWKLCFATLKHDAEHFKNVSNNWLHYKTHFFLCWTRFRHCILQVLLDFSKNCTMHQSILVQKYSAYVSEGEVFQDCNFNMVYPNCPGGDPRPSRSMITRLMGEQYLFPVNLTSSEAYPPLRCNRALLTFDIVFQQLLIFYFRVWI